MKLEDESRGLLSTHPLKGMGFRCCAFYCLALFVSDRVWSRSSTAGLAFFLGEIDDVAQVADAALGLGLHPFALWKFDALAQFGLVVRQ